MDVLEEHLDEAAFLWTQWERALVSPLFALADIAELEERLLAHVDGLVVGGEAAATELLLPGLETDELERIAVSALALLGGSGKQEREELLKVFDTGDEVQRTGIGRALGLSEAEGLEAVLIPRLTAEPPGVQLAALQALAFRGAVPPEVRMQWLYRDDAGSVVAALRVPRSLPQQQVQTVLPPLLADPRPGVREAALAAGFISGARGAWKACRKVAEEGGAGRRQALVVVALGGDEKDAEWMVGCCGRRA